MNCSDKDTRSKPYYVAMTGSKNNAGDFLIKRRAFHLFELERQDRSVIDLNAWEPISDQDLETINGSKALLLLGGPSLQKEMYPRVYPLRDDLSDIEVPIITLGVGWKSQSGDWFDSRRYNLSKSTLELLEKTQEHDFKSSVRDYRTLNVLQRHGFGNFLMTGCPALYDESHLGKELTGGPIKNISFSLGVSFVKSKAMERQMKELIITTGKSFPDANLVVVFHHSIDERFKIAYLGNQQHLQSHRSFVSWLDSNKISYVDISGSADDLIQHYSGCDLHLGYRVHAHIFMNSICRRSVLLAEDGRGKALSDVLGGLTMNAMENVRASPVDKLLHKFFGMEIYSVDEILPIDILSNLNYEIKNDYPRMRLSLKNIEDKFSVMKTFLNQLP